MKKVDIVKKDLTRQELCYYKEEVLKAVKLSAISAGIPMIIGLGLIAINKIKG